MTEYSPPGVGLTVFQAYLEKMKKTGKKKRLWFLGLVAGLVVMLAGGIASMASSGDWRTASREPTGIAPDPAIHKEAIVQVYTARAFSWRRFFAVHSWIAVKPTDAEEFTVYEVIGWRKYRDMAPLVASNRPPDMRWFGAEPEIILDKRGAGVDDLIRQIERAADHYPHANDYTVWPGPNSNTFTAHVGRQVPDLGLDLPPTAIGKDYISGGAVIGRAPSGGGVQVSVIGLLGFTVAMEEGLEVNLLGLSFGVDPLGLAIKLPFVGRVGLSKAV